MKKLTSTIFFTTMLLGSQTLFADDKSDAPLSFWEKLRVKIEQITPQKKLTATTAVGGVRGAKMAVDDVYWKGEKIPVAVDSDELDAFKHAMILAGAGELAKAQAAFTEFVAKNPDSPLRIEADQALAQLQAPK